jgi:hypothetical protein
MANEMLKNPVMEVRLAIMKVIANSWKDSRIKDKIIAKGGVNSLAARKATFKEMLNDKGELDLSLPASVGVNFIEQQDVKWVNKTWGDKESVKEQITLCLPTFNRDDVDKLGEFYRNYPTFMGTKTLVYVPEKGPVVAAIELAADATEPVADGNKFDLGVADDMFLSFGAVVMRWVADANSDQSFKSNIEYDPSISDEGKAAYFKKINDLIKKNLGAMFNRFWNINIAVVFAAKDATEYTAELKAKEEALGVSLNPFWDGNAWKDELNPNVPYIRSLISIAYPESPEKKEEMLIALAEYNCLGPKFPFTCS